LSSPSNLIADSTGYAASRGHAFVAFAILFALMMLDYIDRSIVASMFPYIKADWGLTDTQLGSLASIVPLLVGTLSMPIALLVDRWSRVKSIVLMAALWSLATAGCMLAGSYSQLLALRGAVGVGEAGYGNAGSALLAHHFPARIRSTVVGAFYFASSLGTLVGIVLGGMIAAEWGWRAAFGIVGIPGAVLALTALAIRDYPTVPLGALAGERARAGSGASAMDIARELLRPRTALLLYVGSALAVIAPMAMGAWLPSFFARTYDLQGAAAGIKAAPVILAVAAGTVVWARVADGLALRSPRRRLQVAGVCCVASPVILFPTFLWLGPGTGQYMLIMFGAFTLSSVPGIAFAVAMDVSHPGLRSTACSIVTMANNLIGMSAGPFVVGVLSDRHGLPLAMAMVTLFSLPAAVFLAWAARHYEADKARIDAFC
jgi:MFS family permease